MLEYLFYLKEEKRVKQEKNMRATNFQPSWKENGETKNTNFWKDKNINDMNIKNCGAWSCLKRKREPSNLGTNTDQGYVSNPKQDWTVQIHKCK